MTIKILTGVGAFVAAAAVSLLIGLLTKKKLTEGSSLGVAFSLLRNVVNVAVLAGAFFLGKNTGLSIPALLVGAALGLTVPNLFLMFFISRSIRNGNDNGTNAGVPEESGEAQDGADGGGDPFTV